MRREVRGSWCVLLGSILLASGCGPELPPRPVLKRDPASASNADGGAKMIFMIIPGPPDVDVELWGMAGQREASDSRAIFRVMGPGPSAPSMDQAAIVRKAVADGASALVVVAGDAPGLPAALAEAEAKKVPVILMGKPIDAPAGSPPFTQVRPGAFEPAARKVVEAALADAKALALPADPAAIILVDRAGDLYSAARVSALRQAAEAAGIKKVVLAPFDGGGENAKAALRAALKENLGDAIVLCDDDDALIAASLIRADLARKPTILVGGFAGSRGLWAPSYYTNDSGFVECRNDQLAKLAVWTALARARGESVANVVELEPKFNRGRGADPGAWRDPMKEMAMPRPATEEPPGRKSDK